MWNISLAQVTLTTFWHNRMLVFLLFLDSCVYWISLLFPFNHCGGISFVLFCFSWDDKSKVYLNITCIIFIISCIRIVLCVLTLPSSYLNLLEMIRGCSDIAPDSSLLLKGEGRYGNSLKIKLLVQSTRFVVELQLQSRAKSCDSLSAFTC